MRRSILSGIPVTMTVGPGDAVLTLRLACYRRGMEIPFIFGTRDLLTGRRGMEFSTLLRGYGTCQVSGESESGVPPREKPG